MYSFAACLMHCCSDARFARLCFKTLLSNIVYYAACYNITSTFA